MKKYLILITLLILAISISSCKVTPDKVEETVSPTTAGSKPSPTVSESSVPTTNPTPTATEDSTPVKTQTPVPTLAPTQTPTSEPTKAPTQAPTQTPKPTPVPTPNPTPVVKDYNNQVTKASLSYGGIDDLGRTISLEGQVPETRNNKYVGIFYFLWLGAHGTAGPYDNTKIVDTFPDALNNENRWGPRYAHHFWGEPLFGYYRANDQWVMRKHVQMLTDADVDFLVFDTTNATGGKTVAAFENEGGGNNTYVSAALDLLKILDEYYKKGYDVPKVAFYTNSNSGNAMSVILNEVYKAHPEYSHLWFNRDGKPMIIGISAYATQEVRSFFRIKESQWPNENRKADGFPWMEFSRSLTDSSVYGLMGKKEVMNVSIAQHNATVRMSAAAWYGGQDRTRSYHNGKVDKSEDAVLYGYNFAEQWEYAIQKDPEMIFITGWNEWVAQRQPISGNQTAVFIDCANIEASRDAEPMKGGYGDNYYLQMIEYIRKFKGTEKKTDVDSSKTITINDNFSQWNNVKAFYKDYTNDIVNRNHPGFGSLVYKNTTGRNDINELKVCSDKDNIYFLVTCVDNITNPQGNNWMNLYIQTGNKSNKSWHGYDFILNRVTPSNGKATLEKCTEDNTFSWSKVADVSYSVSKNWMMVKIPKSALGITTNTFTLQFKWADNCTSGDIFSFYTDGDAAPIGRLNYVYSVK